MAASLRFQLLWPQTAVLSFAAALSVAQMRHDNRVIRRAHAVSDMRDRLERGNSNLIERHSRTMRRVRVAVLESDPDEQQAILSWAADSYLGEMERFVDSATRTVRAVEVPDADPRLELDLDRLEKQLERVLTHAQRLSPALLALRDALALDEFDAIRSAQKTLDTEERTVQTMLRICAGMVRRTATWQARHAPEPPGAVPWYLWTVVGLLALLSLWKTQRPVQRLVAIGGGTWAGSCSAEEAVILSRIQNTTAERDRLLTQVRELNRTAERSQQSARRAEHEVALLQLYNDNLVNSLRSAVVVTDAKGNLTAFNRTARLLLALTDDHIDQPVQELALYRALTDHRSSALDALASATTHKQTLRAEGVQFVTERQQRVLDLTLTPYLDETGAARGLLWIADDVTEQLQTKTQLLAAERLAAVGRLSAQVAHEIRNPLSAIALNAELLEEEIATRTTSPESQKEAVQLLRGITSEIERLTEVTQGYLQLARLPRPRVRPADVNQLVEELFAMLRKEMKNHGIQVHLDLGASLPPIAVDPGQLRQAMLNIVRNSREAMPSGGDLRVCTQVTGSAGVSIKVTDTGGGIPEHLHKRVFEPFFSTKPSGTGLGLSLTDQIISEHRGTVSLSSTPTGTEFTIVLPIVSDATNAGAAQRVESLDDDTLEVG